MADDATRFARQALAKFKMDPIIRAQEIEALAQVVREAVEQHVEVMGFTATGAR